MPVRQDVKIMSLPHLSHPKYRRDIDGLRAIAVLSVVVFHAFPNWIRGGFVGVDIFFVISGYLISTIIFDNLDKGTFSFSEFYARRIKRIYPALVLVLVACCALGWFVLLTDEYKQLGKHIVGGAGFVSNLVLWSEAGYFDNSADTKPLLHLWSLGVEEQFYIVWPILLWFGHKKRWNLLGMGVCIAVVSFLFSMYQIKVDATADFYSPLTRFWELMSGSILAWVSLYRTSFAPAKASAISVLALLLLVCGLWGIRKSFAFPGAWALIPVLGAVLIIFAGPQAWVNRRILSNRLFVWVGLISFPLYLWHWPLLSFARIMGYSGNENIRLMLLGASVFLAWITYALIETPLRRGAGGRWRVPVLASLSGLCACVGLYSYANDGLNSRFPPAIRYLTQEIDFKWNDYIQYEKCHLQFPMSVKHQPQCLQSDNPVLGLWGDSHASSLYPGLASLQDRYKFGLVQLTEAGCPPLLGFNKNLKYPHCEEINNSNLRDFVKVKPKTLVIHSAWILDDYHLTNNELRESLVSTLETLKSKLPSTRIVIVGPVPRWNVSPQKTAIAYAQSMSGQAGSIPDYLDAAVLRDIESIVKDAASAQGVEYFSPVNFLCHDSKCLWKVGDKPTDLVSIDYGHLSKSGATFVANKIAPMLFGY